MFPRLSKIPKGAKWTFKARALGNLCNEHTLNYTHMDKFDCKLQNLTPDIFHNTLYYAFLMSGEKSE